MDLIGRTFLFRQNQTNTSGKIPPPRSTENYRPSFPRLNFQVLASLTGLKGTPLNWNKNDQILKFSVCIGLGR